MRYGNGKRKWRLRLPDDPSEEKAEGDPMARFGSKIGDDLRDLGNPPAEEAEKAEPKGYLAAEVVHTVLKVHLHPSHTAVILLISRHY